MSNVLTIPGIIPAVNPREPNEALVGVLRQMLIDAEAGEIVGMAVSVMHGDGLAAWKLVGQVGSFSMIGAARMVERKLIQAVDDTP